MSEQPCPRDASNGPVPSSATVLLSCSCGWRRHGVSSAASSHGTCSSGTEPACTGTLRRPDCGPRSPTLAAGCRAPHFRFPRSRSTPGAAAAERFGGRLLVALADEQVDPDRQAVLFYCWTPDVRGLRDRLLRAGVEGGELTRPFSMPAGEIRVVDPDGYVLLLDRLGGAAG